TGPGARLLARRLAAPSTDPAVVARRLDAVGWLVADSVRRQKVRDALAAAPDLARALSRLTLDRGGPRDLAAIGAGLAVAAELARMLAEAGDAPAEIAEAVAALNGAPAGLVATLAASLADDLPHLKRDGGFIRDAYSA